MNALDSVAGLPVRPPAALLSRLLPCFRAIEHQFECARNFLHIRNTLETAFPACYQSLIALHPQGVFFNTLQMDDMARLVAALVENLFPVHDLWLEEMLGEGGIPYIPILCQNITSSWDDFDEACRKPDRALHPQSGATWLFFLLGYSVTDKEVWSRAAQRFHWPQELTCAPDVASSKYELDKEALYANLESAGLADFVAAARLSLWDTGSVFLDLDDGMLADNPFDFTAEQIQFLAAQWQVAEQILESSVRAGRAALRNPALVLQALDCYRRASRLENDAKPDDETNTEVTHEFVTA